MQQSHEHSEFLWVGNWPAIDFVNTEVIVSGEPVSLLPDAAAFLEWLREAGIAGVKSTSLKAVDEGRTLAVALGYRTLLRKSLSALVDGRPLPSRVIPETNAYLAASVGRTRLIEHNGRYQLASEPQFRTPEAFVTPIAHSLAKLLSEADLRRLRKCKNPDCILYFYDTTKSGTRAWCSLDLCGNKLRMAASRQKRLLRTL